MPNESQPILVIGAGGAGLVAAWNAARTRVPVILFERNTKAGIKLLISGGGKCNVTHSGSAEEIGGSFLPREARFLKHALYAFSPDAVRSLLHDHGVPTIVRDNGRVFPAGGRAADVVRALTGLAREAGTEIRLNARVTALVAEDGVMRGVMVGEDMVTAGQVILATGGASYRKTGTIGDGYGWVRAMGHTVIPVRPALAPMRIRPPLPPDWRGIAVRGGRLEVVSRGKRIMTWTGDILCTHEGLSGPAALEVSRAAAAALQDGPVTLRLDFFPDREFPSLDASLNDQVQANRGRQISTILESWLPNRMVPRLLAQAEVPPSTRGHTLTRDQRRAVVAVLKSWEIGQVEGIDIDRGEVTAGGVRLDEVDPGSMRSRIVRGLYLAGEILDIAGPVGGYNLQAAFSTGFVAGASAAADWLELNPRS